MSCSMTTKNVVMCFWRDLLSLSRWVRMNSDRPSGTKEGGEFFEKLSYSRLLKNLAYRTWRLHILET